MIEDWLDTPVSAREIESKGVDKFDADPADQWFLRNVVSATDAYRALNDHVDLKGIQRPTPELFGAALKHVPGFERTGAKCRRFGQHSVWFSRDGKDGPRYIPAKAPAPETDDLDDLI